MTLRIGGRAPPAGAICGPARRAARSPAAADSACPRFGALAPVPETGYGFGLGFAVRTAAGQCPLPGSVGEYFWGGVYGTAFWIAPVEQLVVVTMMLAPERRLYYRHLLRPLV